MEYPEIFALIREKDALLKQGGLNEKESARLADITATLDRETERMKKEILEKMSSND